MFYTIPTFEREPNMARIVALEYAWTFLGTWYSWGGDDPSGIDCSGFTGEVMQASGIMKRNEDLNATGQYERFKGNSVPSPYGGCLVFFKNKISGAIEHVELCLTEEFSIGAQGGGSSVTSKEIAIAKNAFVKIRPIESDTREKLFVDPFLKKIAVPGVIIG